MPPGSTSRPLASISRVPPATALPSVAMIPALMPMSQRAVSDAVTIVPLRMTRSYSAIGGVSPIVAPDDLTPHPTLPYKGPAPTGAEVRLSGRIVVYWHDRRLGR